MPVVTGILAFYPLRGVDSAHLQILLIDTCRQCGLWSVAGHNHRKVIGRVGNKCIAVRKVATQLRELTCHMGSQYYLPPGRGDIPALTPAEAGTRLSDPGGMQG